MILFLVKFATFLLLFGAVGSLFVASSLHKFFFIDAAVSFSSTLGQITSLLKFAEEGTLCFMRGQNYFFSLQVVNCIVKNPQKMSSF